MVFEHQMHAVNLLVRVGWDARVAQFAQTLDVTAGPLRDAIDELVDYFLFVDEAPLRARVTGTAAYAERFSAAGPRDRLGRSLRELDMTTRMMRYPCSYMIYSAAFDGLPTVVRDRDPPPPVADPLRAGPCPSLRASVPPGSPRDHRNPARDTKQDLPRDFRPAIPGPAK